MKRRSEAGVPLYFGWIVVGSIAAIDTVWLVLSGHTIAHPKWKLLVAAILIFGALSCRTRWPRAAARLQALAQNLFLGSALLIFVYLCVATNFPLRDAWFAAADRAMGFNYLAVYDAVASSRVAWNSLALLYFLVYAAENTTLLLVTPFVSIRRNTELVVTLTVATVICSLIAVFVPAEGAIIYHGASPDPQTHVALVAGLKTFTDLREGQRIIDFAQLNDGLITFPSFHAAAAVFYSYIVRGTGRLFRAVAIANALMLISIPVIGGHYLVDVIAGLIVGGVTIVATRTMTRAWEKRASPHRVRVDAPVPGAAGIS